MTTTRTPPAQNRRAPRLPLWLPALTLATFAIGTADMVVAGVLPDVAADLAVSQAAAGQLVTVFSLTYGLAKRRTELQTELDGLRGRLRQGR